MRSVLVLALLVVVAFAVKVNNTRRDINAPVWYQCDNQWGGNQLGTCSDTICSAGCAMTSVSMFCASRGWGGNPAIMNDWLRNNGGYVNGCYIVWAAPDAICNFQFIAVEDPTYEEACNGLSAGHGIVLNVENGGHYVLATGCAGNGVYNTNDPARGTNQFSHDSVSLWVVYH